MTLTGGPPGGHDAPPSLQLRPYISETIQISTPKPYIFLFHMLRCIQWHQPGSPWGHATIPSLYKWPVITGRGLCIALQYYCILFHIFLPGSPKKVIGTQCRLKPKPKLENLMNYFSNILWHCRWGLMAAFHGHTMEIPLLNYQKADNKIFICKFSKNI